jgi:hypothetical protein
LKDDIFTQRAQRSPREDQREVPDGTDGCKNGGFFEILATTLPVKTQHRGTLLLRSLRPLRETHSVSPPEHFPTPNSEEPEFYQELRCNGSL